MMEENMNTSESIDVKLRHMISRSENIADLYKEALGTIVELRSCVENWQRRSREWCQRCDKNSAETYDSVEWIRWEDRQPSKGEAGWVIFRDDANGRTWIQEGTVVVGQWWHYRPLAWQPKPTLPFWAEA